MMWTLASAIGLHGLADMLGHVPVLVIRTVIAFLFVMLTVRWTGKRSIANLAPFDLAMVIMIGEVAAIPVADLDVDFLHGMLPVLLIGGLHVLMTTINMHSKTVEGLTEGHPTLLVKDGKILKQNLRKERVSRADLFTALRHRDVKDVSEVKEAWIEHAGGISVIRKHSASAATPPDVEQAVERALACHLDAAVAAALDRAIRERHLHPPPLTVTEPDSNLPAGSGPPGPPPADQPGG